MKQPDLFDAVVEPMPLQARRREPEPLAFYRAVRRLRWHGNRVWRAGRDESMLNGRRVANQTIEVRAANLPWRLGS